jgi:hypothetical protein
MKYEFVSDGYAEQLHELAGLLVTPERFGRIAVAAVVEEVQPWEANIAVVDGFSAEATLTRDIYSVIGEEYVNERSPYEEPTY